MTAVEKNLQRERRAILAEMRAKGIRRMSCFNGGHSDESSRLNARLFAVNTALLKAGRETEATS